MYLPCDNALTVYFIMRLNQIHVHASPALINLAMVWGSCCTFVVAQDDVIRVIGNASSLICREYSYRQSYNAACALLFNHMHIINMAT